jgi:hypothetical protein
MRTKSILEKNPYEYWRRILMKDTTSRLNNVFNIHIPKDSEDFLGCEHMEGLREDYITQQSIADILLKANPNEKENSFRTPSAPEIFVVRRNNEEKADETT